MPRDMDLIRKLLIFFRDKPGPDMVDVPPIEGFDDDNIKYHCVLLYDAGFLRCEPITSSTSDRVIEVYPFDLTWSGHEFVDKIANDGIWARVKETVSSRGGVMAYNVINSLATKYALDSVGL
ncbi:DUF2513 domain-containing protein [Crateriforma spongiae]|uniref:DUF2513 domain-containing protein n=1 Tax=Crateriforma spongiae TaxID=2724528 RepID=UPI001447D9B6|nr:DUF2513 domain-containing protein [Crateriforma spongiae]